MRARRLDRRAYFLAHGIEIDEGAFRVAEVLALLHSLSSYEIKYICTGALLSVV